MTNNEENSAEQKPSPEQKTDTIPKNTLSLELSKLPPAYGFVLSILSNLVNPIIDRLDACLRQYKKDIDNPILSTERKTETKFYYGKAMEVRNYLVNFKATGNLPPLTNPHVAYNLFIVIVNQYELFTIMLKESGDLSKPLCGDLLRAWIESLLIYSSHHIPEAKIKLDALSTPRNQSKPKTKEVPSESVS